MSQPVVEIRGLTKSFAGQTVLHDVALSFRPGQIHALVGENGAGKSTLANLISGNLRPDSGEIAVSGSPIHLTSPRQARQLGISFVTQELSLLPRRTVIENVYSGQMPTRVPGIVSRRRMRAQFSELLRATGLTLRPDAMVGQLNAVEQEFAEILRAVAGGARLLILDEPTTGPHPHQAEQIYELIRGLAQRGVAVVLISHDLDDVLRVCDQVSVLRDGRLIRTVAGGSTSKHDLITLMIGRELTDLFPRRTDPDPDLSPVAGGDRPHPPR